MKSPGNSTPRLLPAALLIFCVACTKNVDTPQIELTAAEMAINKAVGTYPCKATFTSWQGDSASITTRLRDTTITVTRIDTYTVQIGGTNLDIYRNPAYQGWRGHTPTRPATTFASQAFGIATSYQVLQVAPNSNSLYFEISSSSRSYGRV